MMYDERSIRASYISLPTMSLVTRKLAYVKSVAVMVNYVRCYIKFNKKYFPLKLKINNGSTIIIVQ